MQLAVHIHTPLILKALYGFIALHLQCPYGKGRVNIYNIKRKSIYTGIPYLNLNQHIQPFNQTGTGGILKIRFQHSEGIAPYHTSGLSLHPLARRAAPAVIYKIKITVSAAVNINLPYLCRNPNRCRYTGLYPLPNSLL